MLDLYFLCLNKSCENQCLFKINDKERRKSHVAHQLVNLDEFSETILTDSSYDFLKQPINKKIDDLINEIIKQFTNDAIKWGKNLKRKFII